MNFATVSLSTIFSCRSRRIVPSAVELLKRGIERERHRFRGRPFIVVRALREFDYDGLTDYVELLQGFATPDLAIDYAKSSAQEARLTTLAEPTYGNLRWRVVESSSAFAFDDEPIAAAVRPVYRERFKMTNDSGYDSKYFTFSVLHVKHTEIIGQDLFAYLGAEAEVTSYLIETGKDLTE